MLRLIDLHIKGVQLGTGDVNVRVCCTFHHWQQPVLRGCCPTSRPSCRAEQSELLAVAQR